MNRVYLIKACLKCGGTLEITSDWYGRYTRCVNCGKHIYLGKIPPKLDRGSDGRIIHGGRP